MEEASVADAARRKRLTRLGGRRGRRGGGRGRDPDRHLRRQLQSRRKADTETQRTRSRPKSTHLLAGIPQSGNSLGSPTAPVTLQYFGDLECPICRKFTRRRAPAADPDTGSGRASCGSNTTTSRPPPANRKPSRPSRPPPWPRASRPSCGTSSRPSTTSRVQEDSGYVTEQYLRNIAEQVPGLNMAKWASERTKPEFSSQIEADAQAANAAGFTGTPSFLIGHTGGATKNARIQLARRTDLLQRSDRKATEGLIRPCGARRLRITLIVLASIGVALAGYLTYLHYSGGEVPCSIKGNPCEPGPEIAVLRARGHPGGPDRPDRLHRDPRLAAGARNRDHPVRHRGPDPRGLRLQRLPHLPRGLHARKNLRVVRRQRDPDDDHDAALAVALPAARRPPPRPPRARRTSSTGGDEALEDEPQSSAALRTSS